MIDAKVSDVRRAAERFAQVARKYCDWAESAPSQPEVDIALARTLLCELHLAVIGLPDHWPETETPDRQLTADDWKRVSFRFQHLPVDGYWDVFDPLEQEEPVFNTLWDDLADIWRDIKEGLILYEKGEMGEAVWDWRLNFNHHWGRHLTSAQRAIHVYLSERGV